MEHHKRPSNFKDLTVKTASLHDRNLQWAEVRTKGTHPARRSYHTAALYADQMLILGGQDIREGLVGGLWALHIDENEGGNEHWEEVPLQGEAPPALCRHSSVQYQDKWYVFGGTDHNREYKTLFELNLQTWQWTAHTSPSPACPPPIDSHSASLYVNEGMPYMVVFGGFIDGNRANELFVMNMTTFAWSQVPASSTNMPVPRAGHTSIVHKHDLFVFGGSGEDTEKLADLWKCDLRSYVWQRIEARGTAPSGRSGHSVVAYAGVMIVFGGVCERNRETNAMYVYEFALDTWTQIQFETLVQDPTSAFLQEEASPGQKRPKPLASPTKADSSSPSRSLVVAKKRTPVYSGPANPTFGRIMGNIPHPRDGHSAVVYGERMYVFGGDRGQMPFNDVYAYNLDETAVRTPVTAL